jgi:hypothetical protein
MHQSGTQATDGRRACDDQWQQEPYDDRKGACALAAKSLHLRPASNVPSAQVRGYMPGSFEIIHPGTNVHMSWDTNSPVGPRHTLLFSVTCVRPRWKLRRSSSGSQAIYTFESGGAQVVVDQVCLAPDGRVRGLISDASGRMLRFQCRGARVAD